MGLMEGQGDSIWLRGDKKAGWGFGRADIKVEEADQLGSFPVPLS